VSAKARLAGVLLAAGRSERYGAPKLDLRLEGESLRRRSARALVEAGLAPIVASVRRLEDAADLPEGVTPVVVPEGGGQGDSLAAAMAALMALPEAAACGGVLVALADQPLAGPAVRAVLAAFDPEREPAAGAARGAAVRPPVAFARALWPELAASAGETAGKAVLERLGDRVRRVSVSGPWHLDVDTPPDLVRLRAELAASRSRTDRRR
jgi:molybdenum cofactor cytidylyltransferase